MPSASVIRRDRGGEFLEDDGGETLERLVEEEQRGVGGQCTGDCEHLLLAAGELVAHVCPALREAGKSS